MAYSGTVAPLPLISVLLPTRNRPALAQTFLASLAATARSPERLEVVLYIDEDDHASLGIDHPGLSIQRVVGPSVTMGAANSACLARSSGEIVILANDDVVVQTPGWDARFRACHQRFPDRIYLAWPDDGFASHRISTFPVLSRRACDLLADPYPSIYRSAFIDYELFDIYTRLRQHGHDRMVYLSDVLFEHHHHRTGKRHQDETSRRHVRFGDDGTFLARSAVRQRQADRLSAAIEGRDVPSTIAPAISDSMPNNVGTAVRTFAQVFFGDRGLPLQRRAYLFVWFCGRYIAARWRSRGLLPQF